VAASMHVILTYKLWVLLSRCRKIIKLKKILFFPNFNKKYEKYNNQVENSNTQNPAKVLYLLCSIANKKRKPWFTFILEP
jgi:hypothetical protein